MQRRQSCSKIQFEKLSLQSVGIINRVQYDPLGNKIIDEKGQEMYENVPPDSPAGKVLRELQALQ